MQNILTVFNHASEDELKFGMAWYPYASYVAQQYANKYGVTKEVAAGVIAALSPNNRWERNLVDAENLIKGFKRGDTSVKVCTFGPNKEKAIQILSGGHIPEILKGPKTNAFFKCIMNPYGDNICIDFHAANIFEGEIGSRSLSEKEYQFIAGEYVKAAKEVNLSPPTLQAITWVTWRNNRENLLQHLQSFPAKQMISLGQKT
jgi:hypothetical protein